MKAILFLKYCGSSFSSVFSKEPGAKVVHDPRAIWNTIDIISERVKLYKPKRVTLCKGDEKNKKAIYGGKYQLIITLGICILRQ